jgi:Lipocalin-like domain
MVSWTRKSVATGEITDAMGADPIGYIAYHADGRMMALVVNRHRAKLKGTTGWLDFRGRRTGIVGSP